MSIKTWNSLAPEFEKHVFEIVSYDMNGILKEQVELVSKENKTAADLGCGTGSLLPHLSCKFETVYAVDFAAELLKVAKQKNDGTNVQYLSHNLAGVDPLPFTVDVTFSVNTLIGTNNTKRMNMAKSIWRTTKRDGLCFVVVPSMESIIHIYQSLVRCKVQEKIARHHAISTMNRLHKKEVLSPVDGVVNIGGVPTKCYTREEITIFLSEIGFTIERILRVEYPWAEEIDNPPRWLKEPYPWDWLIIGRRS
ncbi:MAG: class I SAM-dependent methyltransferase [Candidatus Brocadiaceae bacterium]|nr:class I SAM-dependent methyltransferase [Candidatus Brocadiaceae bacterium]